MKQAFSWISLAVFIAAFITGVVLISIYALHWILFYLLGSAFVLILLAAAFYLSYPESYKPIGLAAGALILIGLVVASGFAPLSIPIAVTVGAIIVPILAVHAVRHGGYAPFLHWHLLDKGLGGSAFADIANMVGVFAGIGAYRLVSGNPTLVKAWWWIGQFGAFLAAVVSLSLLWRWVHPPAGSPADTQKLQKFPALFNWVVATGTIVSLYSPNNDNRSFVKLDEAGANGAPAAIYWLVLLGLLVIALAAMLIYRRKRFFEDWQAVLVSAAFMLITIAAAITVGIAIWKAYGTDDWSVAGTVIGMIAVTAWITGELINFIFVTRDWKPVNNYIKVVEYLDWEKNLWEVVGGLGTILFIAGNTWRKTDWQTMNDYLFIIAASLGFLGTLRGILRGVLKQMYQENYEYEVASQLMQAATQLGQAQTTAAQRQRLFLATSATAAQRRGVIQARDATILQRDATIAQRDAAINNLQLQLTDKDDELSIIRERLNKTEKIMADLDSEVKQRSQRIQEMSAELRESASQLRREQESKQAEIAALRKEIEELKKAVSDPL
jgi:hypothetical protein